MNIADIAIAVCLTVAAAAAVGFIIYRRSKGKSCGGCCESCGYKCFKNRKN